MGTLAKKNFARLSALDAIYYVPILLANILSINDLISHSKTIFVPKHLRNLKTRASLILKAFLDNQYHMSEH